MYGHPAAGQYLGTVSKHTRRVLTFGDRAHCRGATYRAGGWIPDNSFVKPVAHVS